METCLILWLIEATPTSREFIYSVVKTQIVVNLVSSRRFLYSLRFFSCFVVSTGTGTHACRPVCNATCRPSKRSTTPDAVLPCEKPCVPLSTDTAFLSVTIGLLIDHCAQITEVVASCGSSRRLVLSECRLSLGLYGYLTTFYASSSLLAMPALTVFPTEKPRRRPFERRRGFSFLQITARLYGFAAFPAISASRSRSRRLLRK